MISDKRGGGLANFWLLWQGGRGRKPISDFWLTRGGGGSGPPPPFLAEIICEQPLLQQRKSTLPQPFTLKGSALASALTGLPALSRTATIIQVDSLILSHTFFMIPPVGSIIRGQNIHQMNTATYNLNWPKGRFSENILSCVQTLRVLKLICLFLCFLVTFL